MGKGDAWRVAKVRLQFQVGRATLSDGSGGRKTGLKLTGSAVPTDKVFPVPDDAEWRESRYTADDRVARFYAWQTRVIRQVEQTYGIPSDGWITDAGLGMFWCDPPVPKVKPTPGVTGVCVESVHGAGGWESHTCNRPLIDGARQCRIHAAGLARRQANDAARAAEFAQRQQGRDRDRAKTEDLRRLWADVCDDLDVVHRGADPLVVSGQARVDDEVLMMVLRQLQQVLRS